jgi:F0F1-type ATP synthase assembly protein I
MPSDNKTNGASPTKEESRLQKAQELTNQSTLAFELPFTFVGTVAVGGFIGYFLDKWLHTGPWLMVVFGTFGFVAGVMEMSRRLGPGKSGNGRGAS